MRPSAWPGLLLGSLLATATVAAEAPSDFASGLPLTLDRSQPFHRIELPLAVYTQARPDLADVRVFNGAGEPLPYALHTARPPAVQPTLTAVPYFPVRGDDVARAGSLDVKIQQSADGRIIALQSTGDAAGSRPITSYLLDLSALRRPVQALRLDWPAQPEGYGASARLEASDDLKTWQPLAEGPLLDMRFGGQVLQQKRLAFGSGQHRYLRLSADRPLPTLSGTEVEVLPERLPPSPAERWHEVRAEAGDKPGDYLFDLGAHLTAARLQLQLPELNTVAPAELLVRSRRQEEWRPVARATFYRIAGASGDIASPAIGVGAQPGRYWLLRLNPQGGGIGQGMPVLRLAWTSQQLVFLARGEPPFTLAYGQRDARAAQLPLASLLPGYRPGMEASLPLAEPGQPVSLGGRNAPLPGQEDRLPADWKRWLLWLVLLAGVALLALMARSLMRQLPRT